MNSTLALIFGYLIGQGGGFILQMYCRRSGYVEQAGLLVIFYSMFSFVIQFSELGGATYIARKYNEGRYDEIGSFVVGRSIFAAVVTSVVSLYFYRSSGGAGEIHAIFFIAPFLAFVFGLIPISVLEANKDYVTLSVMQAAMWMVATSGGIILVFFKSLVNIYLYFSLFVSCVLYAVCFFRRARIKNYMQIRYFVKPSIGVLPFMFGAIGGQVWGRYILLSTESNYGLGALGALGVVKYVQVASCLFLSFLMRPNFQKFLKISALKTIKNIAPLIVLQRYPIYLAILLAFTGAILGIFNINAGYESVIGPWMILMVSVPIWVFNNMFSQLNQLNIDNKFLVLVEIAAISVNIILFSLLVKSNPVYAIVFGEFGQTLFSIFVYGLVFLKNNRTAGLK